MNTLPDLSPGRWMLVIAPHAANPLMMELAARLARLGPVRIVDGGDRFRAHIVARSLRRNPPPVDPRLHAALERIQLARAFTCYQLVTLLEDLTCAAPRQPQGRLPTLALDLLSTFYDENVSLAESRRLLDLCLAYLQGLSAEGPLAVSVRPPRAAGPRSSLVDQLAVAAGQVVRLEPDSPPQQPRLF
jgi:hypothetical protein